MMRLDDRYQAYLEGKTLSTNLEVKISQPVRKIDDRISVLEQASNGKKIIDLGCADHFEQIESKIKQNVWLHARLADKAVKCLGIDIDQEGIAFLQQKMGYHDVIAGDITNNVLWEIKDDHWDLMILGEVLEHIDNPVRFLDAIRENYAENVEFMVITVPNFFAISNQRKVLEGLEVINSDHRYWFTPYTLAKVLVRSGFQLDHYQFCERYYPVPAYFRAKGRMFYFARDFILQKFPILMNTIVFWAKF